MWEWVKNVGLSGVVGASIIGALVWVWKLAVGRKQPPGADTVAIPEGYSATPSIDDIYADAKSRPPLQQESAWAAYRGLKIYWKANYRGASERKGDIARLWVDAGKMDRAVVMDIQLSSFPELKIAKRGLKLWVAGTIAKVDDMWVELTDAIITRA